LVTAAVGLVDEERGGPCPEARQGSLRLDDARGQGAASTNSSSAATRSGAIGGK
jgi:hypothetical protein